MDITTVLNYIFQQLSTNLSNLSFGTIVHLLLVISEILEATINELTMNNVFPSQDVSEVRYLLWTRSNSGDLQHYTLKFKNIDNLENSPFNEKLRTYFLIHGWTDRGDTNWILDIKSHLLNRYECNVISVDWRTLARTRKYYIAVRNVYKVAKLNSKLIDWLVRITSLTTKNIHIIGHSLGAQMAGLTGKYIITSGKIDRITGLDPAGPLFYRKSPEERIHHTDASLVDIIHSNSGSLIRGCVGLYGPLGHVDYYPNGGQQQPGCFDQILNFQQMFYSCSHARAHAYFKESLLAGNLDEFPLQFISWPCEDYDDFEEGKCSNCEIGCLNMGMGVSKNYTGTYFLKTNEYSPFAKGPEQK